MTNPPKNPPANSPRPMRESYLPITNIEDALQYIAQRDGRIEFRPLPEISMDGIVTHIRITGASNIILQSEWAHPQVEIDNANYCILMQTIIEQAERIRREDAKTDVGFTRPETPR